MALDEQLRELAAQVPPPPPGDAAAVYGDGRRRHRRRQGATFAAAAVLVALLGVAAPSMFPGATPTPEVADRPDVPATERDDDGTPGPPAEPSEPIQPAMSTGSDVPFPHGLRVWSTDERRREWCVAAFTDRRPDGLGTVTADQCQWRFRLDEFPHTGPPLAMGAAGGPDGGLLVWGIERLPEPGSTNQTSVLFDGETAPNMHGGTGGGVPFGVWSIATDQPPSEVIEVRDAGETVATLAWPPAGDDDWAAEWTSPELVAAPDPSPAEQVAGILVGHVPFLHEGTTPFRVEANDEGLCITFSGRSCTALPTGDEPVGALVDQTTVPYEQGCAYGVVFESVATVEIRFADGTTRTTRTVPGGAALDGLRFYATCWQGVLQVTERTAFDENGIALRQQDPRSTTGSEPS